MLVVNHPGQSKYYDLFFEIDRDSRTITSSWSEKYSTINEDGALWGAPTRKMYMLPGWDDNNVL